MQKYEQIENSIAEVEKKENLAKDDCENLTSITLYMLKDEIRDFERIVCGKFTKTGKKEKLNIKALLTRIKYSAIKSMDLLIKLKSCEMSVTEFIGKR